MTTEELMAFLRKHLIAVVCLGVSALIGFLIYYRMDLLPEAEKVLGEKSAQGALLAANIEDSAQLKEQHAALIAANEAITDRMIHIGQLAENTAYFYRLESETGTKLSDPKQIPWTPPGKGAPKTNFTWVTFSVSAQGEYLQLLDLLRKLETGEHYCRINTCLLKPLGEQMRGTPLSMTVNLDLMAVPE